VSFEEQIEVDRRRFLRGAMAVGAGAMIASAVIKDAVAQHNIDPAHRDETIKAEKIRRFGLAGPPAVTKDATVMEMDEHGGMHTLEKGTNEWVCIPGDENLVGWTDMAVDPMGMVWLMDFLGHNPKSTNTTRG
jgi:hypothetical protein